MPDAYLDVDTAVTIPMNVLPCLDDTTFKDIEEGLVFNQAGLDLNWNFITSAGVYSQTNVVPTDGGDYPWAHKGNGMYSVGLPASGGASVDNDTEGYGWFTGVCTGVLPWCGPRIGLRAAGLNDKFCDSATEWDTTVESNCEKAIRDMLGVAYCTVEVGSSVTVIEISSMTPQYKDGLDTDHSFEGGIMFFLDGNCAGEIREITDFTGEDSGHWDITVSPGFSQAPAASDKCLMIPVTHVKGTNSASTHDADAVWAVAARTLTAFGFTPSLHGDYDAAKGAAQAGEYDTEMAHIDVDVSSRAATGAEMDLVDAPNANAVAAIQSGLSTHNAAGVKTAMEAEGSMLEHLHEMTEDDAGTRRLTENALEEAPSGSLGATGKAAVARIVHGRKTWYVDSTRPNNDGDGTTWDTAKKTVAAATALMTHGDRIEIALGIYDESLDLHTLSGCEAVGLGNVSIVGGGLLSVSVGSGCVLHNLWFQESEDEGLYLYAGSDDTEFYNCTFIGAKWGAVPLTSDRVYFERCKIRGKQASLQLFGGATNTVRANGCTLHTSGLASGDAHGVEASRGVYVLRDCEIYATSTVDDAGNFVAGASQSNANGTLKLINCTLKIDTTGDTVGAGVRCTAGNLIMLGGSIETSGTTAWDLYQTGGTLAVDGAVKFNEDKVFGTVVKLDQRLTDILSDTNELQGDWVNDGRLDALIDAIKARSDLLGTAGATVAQLIDPDTLEITIIPGDTYNSDETRGAFEWTSTDGEWGDGDITDAEVTLVIYDKSTEDVLLTVTGEVVDATAPQKVKVEMLSTESDDLTDHLGLQKYQLYLTLANDHVQTIAEANAKISRSIN